MERALHVKVLQCEHRSRVRENPMQRRALSFGPMMSGVVCALLAAVAASVDSPAQADCIVQPTQQAPEGAHWSLHHDRAKNRRCWILVDAAGHDFSTAQPQPVAAPAPSVFQTILGNFTGAGSSGPPAQEAPAAVSPAPASPQSRRPPAHIVSTNRPERVRVERVRVEQRTEPREKGDAATRELTEPEREALFEEFLRWHESQQMIGNPSPR
jgi:hypothetical protein